MFKEFLSFKNIERLQSLIIFVPFKQTMTLVKKLKDINGMKAL
jgi:hypothetical protein